MTVRPWLFAAAMMPLGACQMAAPYQNPQQMAYDQQRVASVIGPRTALPPQNCLVATPSMDIRAVGNTLIARSGSQIYVNHVSGNCREADSGTATLVMEPTPGGLHCSNSTVRVVAYGGMTIGSCVLGPWVPYR